MKIVNTSGKRKTAIARATIRKGNGIIRINSKLIDIYEPELAKLKIMEPVRLAGKKADKVNIDVLVDGGGFMGQASAIRTAIARGLVKFFDDKELKALFH